jgi:RNA recognition motif-containing protein
MTMSNILYIGNLYLRVNKEQLRQLCSPFGTVIHIEFIEGTGYAYVEMSNREEVNKAMRALDGIEFKDRVLRVKEGHITVPDTSI